MFDLLIVLLEDPTPEPTEVKAGPLGFAVWIFMILAVVVIAFSLVKQLRKAQAAKDAGVYGDEPVERKAGGPPQPQAPTSQRAEDTGTSSGPAAPDQR